MKRLPMIATIAAGLTFGAVLSAVAGEPEEAVLKLAADTRIEGYKLLNTISKTFGVTVFGHGVRKSDFRTSKQELSLNIHQLRAFLRVRKIELIWEKKNKGDWVLHVVRRRDSRDFRPQNVPLIHDDDPIPERECIVTMIHEIQNGQGRELFNTIRAFDQRYNSKFSEVQFEDHNDRLVIRGLSSRLRAFRKILKQLDRAPAEAVVRLVAVDLTAKDLNLIKASGPLVGPRIRAQRDRFVKAGRDHIVLDSRLTVRSWPEINAAGLRVSTRQNGRIWSLRTSTKVAAEDFHLSAGKSISFLRPSKDRSPARLYFVELIKVKQAGD